MKSLRCSYRNGHFDDQYSFELEGFMTKQEFAATINSFNSIARSNPPPPPLSSGRLLLFVFCICSCLLSATLLAMHYTHHGSLILAAPLLILFLLVAIHGWRRKLKAKFERSILHMCSCMNATENVRGINFRFIKESPSSCSSDPSMSPCSYYSIIIEFDDRYNLLHHFTTPTTNQPKIIPLYRLPDEERMPTFPPAYRPSVADPPSYAHTQVQMPSGAYHPNEKV